MARALRRIEDLTSEMELVERPVEFDQLVLQWQHMRDDKDEAATTVREAMSRAGHEDVQMALDASGLAIVSPTDLVDEMIERNPNPPPIATLSYGPREIEQEQYLDTEVTESIPVVPVQVRHDPYDALAPDILDEEFATGQIPKVPSEPDDTAVIDDPDAVTSFEPITTEDVAHPRSGPQPLIYMPAPEEDE